MKDLIKEVKMVMKIPYFIVIVAQGIPGSCPSSAMSFFTMWLELIGFSHKMTAFLLTFYTVAASLGALFGGKMGDILSKRLSNSGRIMMAQISSSSAIPLAAILLLLLPENPSTAFAHGLVLFAFGFMRSWDAAATNKYVYLNTMYIY